MLFNGVRKVAAPSVVPQKLSLSAEVCAVQTLLVYVFAYLQDKAS